MNPAAVLDEARRRGLELVPEGAHIRVRGPRQALSDDLRAAIRQTKPALLALLHGREPGQADALDAGNIAAVLIRSSVLVCSVWLAAELGTLDAYPEIEASGLPVFFFDEVERLRSLPIDDLRKVAELKRCFPRAGVLQ